MRTLLPAMLLVFLGLWAPVSPASAFDVSRQGLVLGAGLGGGPASFTQSLSQTGGSIRSDRETKGAFVTDFQIGHGIDDTTVLSFIVRTIWFTLGVVRAFDDEPDELESVMIASSVGVFTLTKYGQTEAPSAFVRGGVGVATWDAPFESNAQDPLTGLGALLGVGYEFAPHWSVELSATWGLPSNEFSGVELETHALSIHVVVVGLAY